MGRGAAAILFSCQGRTTMPATAIACRTGPSETGSDCLFCFSQ